MRTVSESTQAIIKNLCDLNRTTSWFGRGQAQKRICELLSDLAATQETPATSAAMLFLFSDSASVRSAARKAVTHLTESSSPADLLHFAELFDWWYLWESFESWTTLVPAQIAQLAGENGGRPSGAVLGLASFHHSGFVRHEAIRLLAAVRDGSELPFLLIRQNDWVQPIASDAQAAVSCRITDKYLPHLVKSLPIVLHLKRFQRHDLTQTIRDTITLLLAPQNAGILKDVLASAPSDALREIVCGGLNLQPRHRVLLLAGLKSPDSVIRLAACRRLNDPDCDDDLLSKIEELVRDPYMPVRREAICTKVSRFPTAASATWKAALFDRSSSIRELARLCLTRIEPRTNVAEIYRNSLSLKEDFLPAVEGFAETAEECDAAYFHQLMSHSWPSRRRAAIRGLSRLLGEAGFVELIGSLSDPSPRVVREASRLLANYPAKLAGDQLLRIVLGCQHAFSQCTAIDLIIRMGKWRSLPWLIRAAALSPPEIHEQAIEAIHRWFSPPKFNRNFTRPSDSERKAIEDALAESKNSLPAPVVAELCHALK